MEYVSSVSRLTIPDIWKINPGIINCFAGRNLHTSGQDAYFLIEESQNQRDDVLAQGHSE